MIKFKSGLSLAALGAAASLTGCVSVTDHSKISEDAIAQNARLAAEVCVNNGGVGEVTAKGFTCVDGVGQD